jgi:hypothetical protein
MWQILLLMSFALEPVLPPMTVKLPVKGTVCADGTYYLAAINKCEGVKAP